LAAYIPAEYGGRGGRIRESLAVLETASYESLALGLTFGINWALFLQPVAKHAREDVKSSVFARFLHDQALGGLMITEPGHGTDALNMQTSFVEHADHYRIQGTKHWGGLTGMADYWLVAARRQTAEGNLKRDINFFVCDSSIPEQTIEVEELFENLGLYQIPYGRNRVDVRVPRSQRLEPASTGITMMLDMLHRSRMQFPGIGHGFIKRMLDEALAHCRDRIVGGRSLFGYDQVQQRLARMQAAFTVSSAMCAHSSENASVDEDLSSRGVEANSIKTVVSDMMQDAAQSLLQLVGAKGYRLDHVAGRATVDSRPFQIFEGSNDVLYAQISEGIVKLMGRARETNLYRFLTSYHLTSRASDYFREHLDFRVGELTQRRLVDLGRAVSRIVSMEWVIKLGDRGFRSDLIANGVATLREEIAALLHTYSSRSDTNAVEDYESGSSWFSLVAPAELIADPKGTRSQ
ncbi:MAG: acyl-CoA dehydrogenase family protein, partial [Spirochaetota bacterium]